MPRASEERGPLPRFTRAAHPAPSLCQAHVVTRGLARIGIAGIAVALTASLVGCFGPGDRDPAPDPDPVETAAVDAGIGVPIRVEQSEGVGELTLADPTWSEEEPSGLAIPPVNGGYLTLDATWTTLEGTTSMIILYNMVENAAGEGNPYFYVQTAFAGTDLAVGDTIEGDLAFDIGPGPYTFIVTDDFAQELLRFTFEAQPRPAPIWD